MATREIDRHLDRLERTAFRPIRRRSGGGIDYEFYAARARRERARVWRQGLRAVRDGFAAVLRRAVIEPRRRRRLARDTYRELMALDDRMLADIGLRRGDIPAVARGEWWPQPAPAVRIARSAGTRERTLRPGDRRAA